MTATNASPGNVLANEAMKLHAAHPKLPMFSLMLRVLRDRTNKSLRTMSKRSGGSPSHQTLHNAENGSVELEMLAKILKLYGANTVESKLVLTAFEDHVRDAAAKAAKLKVA